MNISTTKYTENELLRELRSNSRQVYYEYTIANAHGVTLGRIEIENGKITYDSRSDVMRSFSGTCRKSDIANIDSIDYRLVPWMCLKIGDDVVKWPLGKFLIEPSEDGNKNYINVQIYGYDLGKIALDDKVDSRIYMNAGSVYTSMALQIAGTDYEHIELNASPKIRDAEAEWPIGSSKLKVINELLGAISYNPLFFDEYGVGHITEYTFPENQSVERTYRADKESVIVDQISKKSNKFEVANKFIRYVENVDVGYMVATYINADPSSPYSTVTRGRTIVDSKMVKDIATQSDLEALTRKDAALAMSITDVVVFNTLNMPGHGYRNCLFVDIPEYEIRDKYIESKWEMELKRGGMMKHYCEKVVTV